MKTNGFVIFPVSSRVHGMIRCVLQNNGTQLFLAKVIDQNDNLNIHF